MKFRIKTFVLATILFMLVPIGSLLAHDAPAGGAHGCLSSNGDASIRWYLYGTTGNNDCNGHGTDYQGSDDDWAYLYDGADTLNAKVGQDYVESGNGHDFVEMGDGNDTAYGGDGNDHAKMGDGNDDFFDTATSDIDKVCLGGGDDGTVSMDDGDGNDIVYYEGSIDFVYNKDPGDSASQITNCPF